MYLTYLLTDFLAPIIYWPVIEASLGIVAACLSLLRPIGPSIKQAFLRSKRRLSTLVRVCSQESQSSSETKSDVAVPELNVHQEKSNDEGWLETYNMS
jgi:hypothetical protein